MTINHNPNSLKGDDYDKNKIWFKAGAVALLSLITAPAYADLSEILASGKVKLRLEKTLLHFHPWEMKENMWGLTLMWQS